jgi:cupin fold WbuC family metalloprotein
MRTKAETPDVLYPDELIVAVGSADLALLKQLACSSPLHRARLCTHRDALATLHEMLIVITCDSYIRPHKHLDRVESFTILEGEADLLLFDDEGCVSHRFELGSPGSGKLFYHRLERAVFHTVIVRSNLAVIHEVTQGPFERERTIFPDWAPVGGSPRFFQHYIHNL